MGAPVRIPHTCRKCARGVGDAEFLVGKSGRMRTICKSCAYEELRLWRKTASGREKSEKYRADNAKRARDGRKNNKKVWAEYARSRLISTRDRQPQKVSARQALRYAVFVGKITKPTTCSKCGITCRTEAHHHAGYSYENRLTVTWLCQPCHKQEDAVKEITE